MNINIVKSISVIKKTRSPKTCSGCGKEIPKGVSCLKTYELLEIRYSNEYFCDVECIKKRIGQFIDMVKFNDE